MQKLVRSRYYWPGWSETVAQYVKNCHDCRRASNPRDKTPGLLRSLPVPERPWQHVSMDFKSMPKDRKGYNNIFVIVDRLSKKPILVPCHKTIGAKSLAELYI